MRIALLLFIVTGCLLDGVPPSAPPDVPPRNPTMNRMNGRVQGNPTDLAVEFEPSCLVRTPSGNIYIPSGNISEYNITFRGSKEVQDLKSKYNMFYARQIRPIFREKNSLKSNVITTNFNLYFEFFHLRGITKYQLSFIYDRIYLKSQLQLIRKNGQSFIIRIFLIKNHTQILLDSLRLRRSLSFDLVRFVIQLNVLSTIKIR